MGNIVAHIYNDAKSYEWRILSLRRVILMPFLILVAIIFDRSEFHFYMAKAVSYFSGRIVQPDKKKDVFVLEKYPEEKRLTKIWRNLSSGKGFLGILPDYKKEMGCSCWTTEEGDYVAYVKLSEVDFSKPTLNLEEFLALTKQTKSEFEFEESIKYSGC